MKHIEIDSIVAIAGEWFTGHGKGVSLGYFGKLENAEMAGKLTKAFSEWIDNGHNDFSDENTTGTGVPRIVLTNFKNFMISYPSVSEQKQIASFLEQLDNLITLHQRTSAQFYTKIVILRKI